MSSALRERDEGAGDRLLARLAVETALAGPYAEDDVVLRTLVDHCRCAVVRGSGLATALGAPFSAGATLVASSSRFVRVRVRFDEDEAGDGEGPARKKRRGPKPQWTRPMVCELKHAAWPRRTLAVRVAGVDRAAASAVVGDAFWDAFRRAAPRPSVAPPAPDPAHRYLRVRFKVGAGRSVVPVAPAPAPSVVAPLGPAVLGAAAALPEALAEALAEAPEAASREAARPEASAPASVGASRAPSPKAAILTARPAKEDGLVARVKLSSNDADVAAAMAVAEAALGRVARRRRDATGTDASLSASPAASTSRL